jgi:predicted HAD superfamily Cof-like phosphohydrolase
MGKYSDDLPDYQRVAVEEFIDTFGVDTNVALWQALALEEARELVDATTAEEQLKEACDLAYVCAGTLIALDRSGGEVVEHKRSEELVFLSAAELADMVINSVGDDVFTEAFKRVHKSNMSKVGDDGKPIKRSDGKVIKGPNYSPPVLSDLIEAFKTKTKETYKTNKTLH